MYDNGDDLAQAAQAAVLRRPRPVRQAGSKDNPIVFGFLVSVGAAPVLIITLLLVGWIQGEIARARIQSEMDKIRLQIERLTIPPMPAQQ